MYKHVGLGSAYRLVLTNTRQKKPAAFRFPGLRKSRESSTSAVSFFLSETGVSRGTPVSVINAGSDMDCSGAPRQKNAASFRFRGLLKCRENCTSAASFFLSETGVSPGTPVSVMGNGSDFPFSGIAPAARNDPLRSNAKGDSRPLSRSPHADPERLRAGRQAGSDRYGGQKTITTGAAPRDAGYTPSEFRTDPAKNTAKSYQPAISPYRFSRMTLYRRGKPNPCRAPSLYRALLMWSFVSLMTTPDRPRTAMRFGIAMRPLSVSAISQTMLSFSVAPITTAMTNTIL